MADPHELFIAMAKDWTDPVVVRDSPPRAADVVRQCVKRLEAAEAALVRLRQQIGNLEAFSPLAAQDVGPRDMWVRWRDVRACLDTLGASKE